MSDSEHDWLRPEEEHETETVIDAGTAQSNPEVADAVAKIAALRQSIDNVDTAIVSLLAERFKYTSQVGVLKARAGFAPADYKREDYQIERLPPHCCRCRVGSRHRRNVSRIRGDRSQAQA